MSLYHDKLLDLSDFLSQCIQQFKMCIGMGFANSSDDDRLYNQCYGDNIDKGFPTDNHRNPVLQNFSSRNELDLTIELNEKDQYFIDFCGCSNKSVKISGKNSNKNFYRGVKILSAEICLNSNFDNVSFDESSYHSFLEDSVFSNLIERKLVIKEDNHIPYWKGNEKHLTFSGNTINLSGNQSIETLQIQNHKNITCLLYIDGCSKIKDIIANVKLDIRFDNITFSKVDQPVINCVQFIGSQVRTLLERNIRLKIRSPSDNHDNVNKYIGGNLETIDKNIAKYLALEHHHRRDITNKWLDTKFKENADEVLEAIGDHRTLFINLPGVNASFPSLALILRTFPDEISISSEDFSGTTYEIVSRLIKKYIEYHEELL